ncbi:MAG TPA: SdpI family protein [Parafilimonas sp.]|nr:SdpI family protein [Parafilimonas sp.]
MNKFLRRVIWLIMLIPAIYLAIIWNHIPEKVPMHFDIKGNVDKYGSKHDLLILILVLTVVNAIVYLVISNIYKIDPRKSASLNKDRMRRMAVAVSIYLSAIWIMVIYEAVHNDASLTLKFVFVAMGLLFALLGNNMYNIQPNYFAGIRLPWTLESEDNWRKTHHVAGRLWFFGGLFFAMLALLLNKDVAGFVIIALVIILVLIPVIYSYNLYRKSKAVKNEK